MSWFKRKPSAADMVAETFKNDLILIADLYKQIRTLSSENARLTALVTIREIQVKTYKDRCEE